jgi:hypothetical protein
MHNIKQDKEKNARVKTDYITGNRKAEKWLETPMPLRLVLKAWGESVGEKCLNLSIKS